MSRGSIHNGFPETGKYYSFKTNNKNTGGSLTRETIQHYTTINEELQVKLCTKHNALCAMYPPKGFIYHGITTQMQVHMFLFLLGRKLETDTLNTLTVILEMK